MTSTGPEKTGGARNGAGSNAGTQADEQEEPFTWSSMNARQKMKHVISNITVEPILLFYIVPNLLSSLTTQNLNLEKACRVNLNLGKEQCDEFSARNITNETAFAEVSRVVSDMQVWQTPLQSAVPIILVLFVGSWSDRRHRRKPFMLLPLFGELFVALGLLLCAIFYLDWPLEVAGVIEAIFPALSGGITIMLLSVFSYVADVTTVESRTFRLGIVSTAVSCGLPIAIALSGVAFEGLGFIGVYVLGTAIYVLAIVYGFLYVREPHPPVPRPPGTSLLADFCNWHHVWDTVKVALKRRAGSRQLQFYLLMLLYVAIQGPIQGETTVSFLYITNRFHWDAIKISAYGTYSIIVSAIGNFVVATILCKWMKLNDCTIGVIAMAAKTISAPFYGYAVNDWQIYLVTASDILGSGAIIAMRAVATKLVESDELGKLMALLAVVEAITPLIFRPVYSKVFSNTIESFPGTFFYISAVISLVGLLLFLAIYFLQKKQRRLESKQEAGPKEADDERGVTNVAFQSDKGEDIRMRNRGVDNTFL